MTSDAAPNVPSGAARPDMDPRGLITEAYKIEGVHEADCRSIFFDWALGLAPEVDARAAIEALLQAHADKPDDHPMTAVLREGLETSARPRRRRRREDAAG